MLVIISDLHFIDGTAGEHNILAKTFEEILHDLSINACNVRAKEVKLVFLGDIFDLLRTEKWFDVPINHRPWGVKSSEDRRTMEKHANHIMDAILTHDENKKSFEVLSGDLTKGFGFPIEPERLYILGNHDRLCGEVPLLFKKGAAALNVSNNKPLHKYVNPLYGVFARHGHEYDGFNYEGTKEYTNADYLMMPIGDPITTELVAKLPYTIMRHKKVQTLPPKEREILKRNLQEIESVRPFSTIIKWLFYQVEKDSWLADIVDDCVKEVVREFREIDFVKSWYKKHDNLLNPIDHASLLKYVLLMLERLNLKQIEFILRFGDLASARHKDVLTNGAISEFNRLSSSFYYVVFGHTHKPAQLPIRVMDAGTQSQRDLVYINTGTWVDKYQAAVQTGFINWNHITYTIFYNKEEAQYTDIENIDYPIFETWNGALKKQKS
ncbi:MAG: hypothetical protein ACOZCL_10700 [Bacillota bacterium]